MQLIEPQCTKLFNCKGGDADCDDDDDDDGNGDFSVICKHYHATFVGLLLALKLEQWSRCLFLQLRV